MDVLVIYQFCTFGGVERAILNRVEALKQSRLNIHISMGYLSDSGALTSFQNYIKSQGLSEHISAFVFSPTENYDWHKHQFISVIDTPQIFPLLDKNITTFVECHTTYHHNQEYLGHLPEHIRGLIVPSISLKQALVKKFPHLPPIHVIPNPVPDNFYREAPPEQFSFFHRRPLAYFARLDALKNFDEALKVFHSLSHKDDIMYIVVGQGAEDPNLLNTLTKKNIIDKTLLRNQIPFDRAPYLTQMVKHHRGIFISPSKGESFGLSAAEFMAARVPVLLSDIPAHRELVEDDENFLYALGNINTATKKLQNLLDNWDEMSSITGHYAEKFRAQSFLNAWTHFLAAHNLPV